MTVVRVAGAVLSLLVVACASTPSSQGSTAGPPAPASESAPAPEPPRPLDPAASPRVETPSFMAELGVDGEQLTLTLERRGEFHLNLEFPLKVELGGSEGAVFAKTVLAAADAKQLDDARGRFELPVQWHAEGPQWLGARVQFATCTPDTCTPHEVSLAVQVLRGRD